MKRKIIPYLIMSAFLSQTMIMNMPAQAYADEIEAVEYDAASVICEEVAGDYVYIEAENTSALNEDVIEDAAYIETYSADEESYTPDTMTLASGVTEDMCVSTYWEDKSSVYPDRVLMDLQQVKALNSKALTTNATNMHDLENMPVSYNAASLISGLKNAITFRKSTIYANQVSENTASYCDAIKSDFDASSYTETSRQIQYAVATKRTTLNIVPTTDYIGWSATDSDNENVNSALNVNDPFVIKQKCETGGTTFYWGYSNNCTGWVDGADLAICADKEEWIDSWKVDIESKDFIVVLQDKIVLEKSVYATYSSEVKLTQGTVLKEVDEEDIPEKIAERGTWNNYVVYLPTRKADGTYEKKLALISQNDKVSEGYLSMTTANILDTAFNCIGNRYGWGGCLDADDCSWYTRSVYKCFGAELPRNTTWQQAIPGTTIKLTGLTDEQKFNKIKEMPSGALLYFSGHTMIYVGCTNDTLYVISATGSLVDSVGEEKAQPQNTVILTPLTVRRGASSGYTSWLHNLATIVCPWGDNLIPDKKNEEPEPAPEVVESQLTMYSGEKIKLPIAKQAAGKMKYVISNTGVASVNKNGVIKAGKKPGETTITAYSKTSGKWIKVGKARVSVKCPVIEKYIYMTNGESIDIREYFTGADYSDVKDIVVSKSIAKANISKGTVAATSAGKANLTLILENGCKAQAKLIIY